MAQLNDLEIIIGVYAIIQTTIYITVGILLSKKYIRFKEKNLLAMGICVALTSQPWWASIVSLIRNLCGEESVDVTTNTMIGLTLQPLALFLWIYVMTLMWPKQKNKILIAMAIFSILFQIMIFYAIFIDPHTFVERSSPLNTVYHSWLALFILIALMLVIFPAILFFKTSIKFEKPEIKLKSTFILIYSVLYTLSALIDAFLTLNLVTLLITRTLLVLAAFFAYNAFAMPDWMKKLFIREK